MCLEHARKSRIHKNSIVKVHIEGKELNVIMSGWNDLGSVLLNRPGEQAKSFGDEASVIPVEKRVKGDVPGGKGNSRMIFKRNVKKRIW